MNEEIDFTSGQIRDMRRQLGLKPGDYLDSAVILLYFDVRRIVDEAAERIDQEEGSA